MKDQIRFEAESITVTWTDERLSPAAKKVYKSLGYSRDRLQYPVNADPRELGFDKDNPYLFLPESCVRYYNIVVGETTVRVNGTAMFLDRDYVFKVTGWNVDKHGWDCEWVD